MGDLVKLNLSMDMYGQKDQFGRPKTLTEVLEEMDPSPEGSALDAFERQMKIRGIYTKDVPSLGISASPVEVFFLTDDNKVLYPEFVRRTVRSAFTDNNILRALIGTTTQVDTDLVKTPYLDRPERKKTRRRRITEATELPTCVIKPREQLVRFYKYGRAIEATYESIRRMKINMLQNLIRVIAMDAALDKAEEAIYTLIKGDGNDNAAPVVKLSELDPNANGALTARAYLEFLMLFGVFPCDTIVATKPAFADIVLTQFPNLTAQDVLSLMVKGNLNSVTLSTPQMPQTTQTLLWHEDIPDAGFTGKKLVGFNRAAGIEEFVESGSTINEVQRFITKQVQVMTITENSGFSKMYKEAAVVLDLDN